MNTYISGKKSVLELSADNSLGYGRVHTLTAKAGYNDLTVSRDPIVSTVIRWSIVILTAVIVLGMVQSFGVMMPWQTGSAIAADAGTIVYLSGNDVMVSIVEANDIDKISAVSLYFENSGRQVNIMNVQPTIRSGESIQIDGMALGCEGEDNIILEAEFEDGTTKVLSTTHLNFS